MMNLDRNPDNLSHETFSWKKGETLAKSCSSLNSRFNQNEDSEFVWQTDEREARLGSHSLPIVVRDGKLKDFLQWLIRLILKWNHSSSRHHLKKVMTHEKLTRVVRVWGWLWCRSDWRKVVRESTGQSCWCRRISPTDYLTHWALSFGRWQNEEESNEMMLFSSLQVNNASTESFMWIQFQW